MKCQHGNEITVIIEAYIPPYLDEGLRVYNKAGEYLRFSWEDYDGGYDYLRVEGCKECKVILHRQDHDSAVRIAKEANESWGNEA